MLKDASQGTSLNIKEWAYSNGLKFKSPEAFMHFITSEQNANEHWAMRDRTDHQHCLARVSDEIPATWVLMKERDRYFTPTGDVVADSDVVKKIAAERLFMYDEDWERLNSDGQMDLARGIAETMKYIGHTKNLNAPVGPILPDDQSCTT